MEQKLNKEFLKELIENLSREIPYKWRVQSFSKQKAQATCVAYIDARDCIELLNKYAVYGWDRDHYEVGETTYCRVGIVMPDGSRMWRSDCGVESQADAEKGESSDSFKRACVNFGIGKFLYSLGMEYVKTNEVKTNNNYPYVVDDMGNRIWDLTKYLSDKKAGNVSGCNKQSKKTDKQAPANKEPQPSALQPNTGFDTGNTKKPEAKPDERQQAAEKEFNKLDQSAVLKYLIKEKGFSYATVSDFIKAEPIEVVLDVYQNVKGFKK